MPSILASVSKPIVDLSIISVMLFRKQKYNTCTLFNKKPVFPTVWRLILTDRILKGWQCHVAKTKFILCFQSESHVVFFFVCVCVLFFCFILFVCFCIPLIVLCSKQKQVSKPGIEIDAGMLDVSSICVYSLKTCFKALIARGFFF